MRQQAGLDVENVAARFGPGQARSPRPAASSFRAFSGVNRSGPSISVKRLGRDRHWIGFALGETHGHFPGEPAERLLQLANARFARVAADDQLAPSRPAR